MIEVVREARVDAPPAQVWDAVATVERLPEWFTFADAAETLDGTGVGRRQRIHGRWGRKRSEVDQVITDWEPPRRLVWVHEAERLNGKPAPRFAAETRFSILLEPVDGATRVRLESRQLPASRVRGLVMRLFGERELGGHLDRSLERLAALYGRAG
jgi:uncharacterized protein YndB with AHSA1/START domain